MTTIIKLPKGWVFRYNTETVTNWLADTVGDNAWDFKICTESPVGEQYLSVTFEDENDAIAFKLRFGV